MPKVTYTDFLSAVKNHPQGQSAVYRAYPASLLNEYLFQAPVTENNSSQVTDQDIFAKLVSLNQSQGATLLVSTKSDIDRLIICYGERSDCLTKRTQDLVFMKTNNNNNKNRAFFQNDQLLNINNANKINMLGLSQDDKIVSARTIFFRKK